MNHKIAIISNIVIVLSHVFKDMLLVYTISMHIAILGRQSNISLAELERIYGADLLQPLSQQAALINTDTFNFEQLGGTQKAGRVTAQLHGNWRSVSSKIIAAYSQAWSDYEGKITLGISAYGFKEGPRDIQKTGIILKAKLKKQGVSVRLIPNADAALNTATSHHNKLGLSNNKVELLVVRADNGDVYVAESCGAQNITALAKRDQGRPKRDAFVGMLPPKLARIFVNLAAGASEKTILDPFCGTGVVLQEALLTNRACYGTDLAEKMIDFSQQNLEWLTATHATKKEFHVEIGDATKHTWSQPFDTVACETYLGQPFSAPPSPAKLTQVRDNCNYIIGTFLKNIHGQLEDDSELCVAVPAWRDSAGHFTHLPLLNSIASYGYERIELEHSDSSYLLYYREDQVVARHILLLRRISKK